MMELSQIQELVHRVKNNVSKVIIGKEDTTELMLIAMLASGHVLLEDVPGTGKTLLAKTIARSLDCIFKRIQFTPDLLPSDVSGINFYNQKTSEFEFRPGPLFAHIVLADEINRATPRTQSSLLECMEERQVSIDGETRSLEAPFLVIATQNPVENQGTFPLPEAQLDRFLLKIAMGYPTPDQEVELLQRFKQNDPFEQLQPVVSRSELIAAQQHYSQVRMSEDLMKYLVRIVEMTRTHPEVALGVSPRGSRAMLKAVQVYALLRGRDYVLPDDIKALAKPVFSHRILLKSRSRALDNTAEAILDKIISQAHVPTEVKLG
jgi:MoxR-like ATPase